MGLVTAMPDPLSKLSKDQRARLFEEMNYLNLEELHGFCSKRGKAKSALQILARICPLFSKE